MNARGASSDRIILLTLVDLLVQIIFFGFLVFAANRAAQAKVQDKAANLQSKFGVISVVRFLDATSKLVAIADLHKIDVVALGENVKAFNETTDMLERIDRGDVSTLSHMDKRQLQTFTKFYAALTPADRRNLSAFLSTYGMDVVREAVAAHLSPKQLVSILGTVSRLPSGDREKFVRLSTSFAKAGPAQRQKLVDEAATVAAPLCFNRRSALRITEVSNGYRVQPLIPDIEGDVARFMGARGGGFIGEGAFSTFAAKITGAHSGCTINVIQSTTTNDERQLKKIQHWFGTW